MLIKIKTSADVPYSEVTPEPIYRSRREFMQAASAGAVGAVAGALIGGGTSPIAAQAANYAALPAAKKTSYVTDPAVDPLNTFEQITSYNNYYEFGTRKTDPARNAGRLTVKPWTVKVDGLVNKPGNYGVEDLVDFNQLEERVYRHRCVERWSMVMPWIGVPLSAVLNKVQPQPGAKFVEFTTLERPSEMPGLGHGGPRFPVRRGSAHGRSDAPADVDGRRALRQGAAEPERARRSASIFPGSTASRAASRSSGSASRTSSRRTRGPCRRRTSTASTRT